MKNTTINLGVIRKIAKALGELNEKVVYIGGATVSLYIDDPAADDVRPTKDIDISLEILTLTELEQLRQYLTKRDFIQTAEENIICRFRFDDINVDVMSTKEVGWAPSDKWLAPGFKHLEEMEIEGERIRVLSLPYFLATKFSAFHDRGVKDARTSKDFEDITYILDNRTDVAKQILDAPKEVKDFLKSEFDRILKSDQLQEAILVNLFYETRSQRYEMIIDKLKEIVK